jgi:hypothetical protein
MMKKKVREDSMTVTAEVKRCGSDLGVIEYNVRNDQQK